MFRICSFFLFVFTLAAEPRSEETCALPIYRNRSDEPARQNRNPSSERSFPEALRCFVSVASSSSSSRSPPNRDRKRRVLFRSIEIVLMNPRGKTEIHRLKDLFPKPFDVSYL